MICLFFSAREKNLGANFRELFIGNAYECFVLDFKRYYILRGLIIVTSAKSIKGMRCANIIIKSIIFSIVRQALPCFIIAVRH